VFELRYAILVSMDGSRELGDASAKIAFELASAG